MAAKKAASKHQLSISLPPIQRPNPSVGS
jgi:hypothetical protein